MPVGVPLRGTLYLKALDAQNPQLIPSMDFPSSSAGAAGVSSPTLDVLAPSKYLSTFPRTDATVTLTVGGTITNGNTVILTFSNAIIPVIGAQGPDTYSPPTYTVVTADTTATVADGIMNIINLDPNLQALGVYATKGGTSLPLQVVIRQSGPIGNFTTVSAAVTGTITATMGNAGVMAGGAGPIIPIADFKMAYNGTVQNFWYAKPQNVGSDMLSAMITAGVPIL